MFLTRFSATPLRAALAGALTFALPVSLAAPPVFAAAVANPQLDQVVTALRGIGTMQADFVQTDRNGQRVKGVLTLKQPGKARFEYEKGVNMLIVANGGALNIVDYDVKQVQRLPIKNSPLGALFDPRRDLSQYGKLVPTTNPDVVSVQVHDPKQPEYGFITLIFVKKPGAPGGLELTSWVALDSQNQRTTVRLSNQRYGVGVSDSLFRFRDPRPTTHRAG
jgi:outer membrane lipoprotein-sorting protein